MKKYLYLLSGVVLGVTIASSTPVIAATVKTITAKINGTVNVSVDGEKVKLNTQPLTYNNLNYLPVGEIGRALGLSVSYDKKTDTINIVSPIADKDQSIGQPMQDVPGYPRPEDVKEEVKTVNLGESITKDGITMTIEKVEYMDREEIINTIVYPKGTKIFYKLTNNSESPIRPTGLFAFTLKDSKFEQEVNDYSRIFEISNQHTLYKGDSTEGFLHIPFQYEISSVSYTPASDSKYFKHPIGAWESL